ncbi:hypothetical protein WJX73_009884 [Symbiochloris irregularis]|uniref:SCP domain-containing protein n=1 Tax=Symbiochloris irregularis TaxID=706552 RepID=A0AAW1PRJ2_9CHLO
MFTLLAHRRLREAKYCGKTEGLGKKIPTTRQEAGDPSDDSMISRSPSTVAVATIMLSLLMCPAQAQITGAQYQAALAAINSLRASAGVAAIGQNTQLKAVAQALATQLAQGANSSTLSPSPGNAWVFAVGPGAAPIDLVNQVQKGGGYGLVYFIADGSVPTNSSLTNVQVVAE